jgi:hypothetical protein
MLFCDASFVTVAATTLAAEAEQEYIQRSCMQTVSCTMTRELLFDFHIWIIFYLSSLSYSDVKQFQTVDLSLISVPICEFSGVLNSHGCLSKISFQTLLSSFSCMTIPTERTNEPNAQIFNA